MEKFSIKKDLQIVKEGGFFCEACVEGKPIIEQSLNPRYCNFCNEIIKHEAVIRKESKEDIMKKLEAQELVNKLGAAYELKNNDGHYYVVQTATGQRVNGNKYERVTIDQSELSGITETTPETAEETSNLVTVLNGKITIEEMAQVTGIKWGMIYSYTRKNGFQKESTSKGKPRYMFTPEQVTKITEALKK